MNNKDLALPAEQDRAVAASPPSPQAVSPVPASIPSAGPTFEQCARVVAAYMSEGRWSDARSCASENQRAHGYCEYKLYYRATEMHDLTRRMRDMTEPYQVVAEMLEYFDSYKLASWAPLASIIERERRLALDTALEAVRAIDASAIEARRAETGTGSVHESAGPQDDAQLSSGQPK